MRHIRTLLFISILFSSAFAMAQPANDECMDAIALNIATDESACQLLEATTVNASPSGQPSNVCSGSSFADDVWFSFTTGSTLAQEAIVIRCYFGEPFIDVPSVGMAVYKGCGFGDDPLECFTTADPENNQLTIFSGDLLADHTYYVRVWSTPGQSDNSGTFQICAFQESSEDIVIWGNNPGEGDFDGGLNGWTSVAISPDDSADWRWAGCACSAGELNYSFLNAPTAHNGAVIFDADSLNCCLDDNPPPPILQQTGELWSPIIDCSDFPAVALKFHQAYEALTSWTAVAYSLDGGNTWQDTITVNTQIGPEENTYSPDFLKIPILEASGATQFRIKFIFSGNFYSWLIDDVQLVLHENNNLDLQKNSIAIAPNAMWPVNQLECFGFQAAVFNRGAAAQPNVNLNVSIEDAAGSEVFNETKNLGIIAPLGFSGSAIIEGCYTPEATPESYTGVYSTSSDSVDFDPGNNITTFSFETTDFVFAKERGGTQTIHPGFLSWNFGEPHSWAYGNFFHIVNGSEDDPKSYAESGTFSIGNADDNNVAGEIISLYLYKWVDDTNQDGNMDVVEREKIAFAFYTIEGTEAPTDLITVPLVAFPDGNPNNPQVISLESNQNYVLMLEYAASSSLDIEFVASTEFDYSSQIALSEAIGSPRYAGMLGVEGDLESAVYSSVGFGRDIVPVVRLNLTDQPVNVENITKSAISLTLSPNPVSNILQVNVNLQEVLSEATIRFFDLNGRLLLEKRYKNIKGETMRFDTSQFTAGAYFLQFVSKTSVKTERFIVQR